MDDPFDVSFRKGIQRRRGPELVVAATQGHVREQQVDNDAVLLKTSSVKVQENPEFPSCIVENF